MEGLSAWEEDDLGAHDVPFFLERAPLPGFLEVFGANFASADSCPVYAHTCTRVFGASFAAAHSCPVLMM